MRGFSLLALIPLGLIGGCAGSTETTPTHQPFDPTMVARLEAAVNETMAEHNIPGAVIRLEVPGQGFYYVAKGVSDKETNAPMRLDNHFRVGSNTKGFTGTVILQLLDEGLLTLDQKVATILEGVPNGENITIRQMLNMTSGLTNYSETDAFNQMLWTDPYHNYTRQELLAWAYEDPIQFAAGTEYEYSNTNTLLLGMVIEELTGKSVAQNFEERLYRPLGMTNTSWPTTGEMPTPFAHGYTDDTLDRSIVDATQYNPNWADAAGQLVSNAEDMAKWAKAQGSGMLISPLMQQERLTWVTGIPGANGTYGLAIGHSGPWLHHQGELPGYNSIAAYHPGLDATIVVLANSNIPFDQPGPAQLLTIAISNVLLESE